MKTYKINRVPKVGKNPNSIVPITIESETIREALLKAANNFAKSDMWTINDQPLNETHKLLVCGNPLANYLFVAKVKLK